MGYISSIFDTLFDYPRWAYLGLLLLASFPVLTVAVGEIAHRLWKSGREPLANAFFFLRNIALPLLFAGLMLRLVAGLELGHIAIKLTDTLVGITWINAIVSFFNALMFAEGEDTSSRNIPKLFLDLCVSVLVALGAAFVISFVWDVNLGAMLTALGVGSVVLGLALQDTLGSCLRGLQCCRRAISRLVTGLKLAPRKVLLKA